MLENPQMLFILCIFLQNFSAPFSERCECERCCLGPVLMIFSRFFFNFFGNSFRIPSQIALKIHSPILLKINLEMLSVIYLRSPSAILLGISLALTLKNPSEITFNFFEQLFWDSFSKFLQHILWEVLHNFF